ncbi:hypothetical protein ACQUQU_00245 [Thalassolituus sp. LLYu03]|uniref:hypothetical protein n=1 Tax=Thalassolituus sp. LLYu03 TaxID=3421656 RepID=UPI003D2DAEAE
MNVIPVRACAKFGSAAVICKAGDSVLAVAGGLSPRRVLCCDARRLGVSRVIMRLDQTTSGSLSLPPLIGLLLAQQPERFVVRWQAWFG